MIAIVDCNNFYCGCERLFKPKLEKRPVVVLSNNDGCIISRTDEAKALGIGMAGPYFLVKDIIQQNNIEVFSSNYNLYGDISWRVMRTLKELAGENNVEVYSVDEAFINLHQYSDRDVVDMAFELRKIVEKWTGIKVSVGVAPTKTLAKLANNMAKKNKAATKCVMVLHTPSVIQQALKQTSVHELWGVGQQYAEKLQQLNILTAWDLYNMSEEWVRKNLGGVVGVRLLNELHGNSSVHFQKELLTKKMIATTRMFGTPVTELKYIKEAVATYTARAAEKLRRQQSAASIINVFIVPKEQSTKGRGTTIGSQIILPTPTLLTHDLIKPAMRIAERIYEEGRTYKKAGVILSGLVPASTIQANLFHSSSQNNGKCLMNMVDNINFSMRDDLVKFASSGIKRNWKMRQEYHSPRYTTRWEELCTVQ